jgi:hypothetical protein
MEQQVAAHHQPSATSVTQDPSFLKDPNVSQTRQAGAVMGTQERLPLSREQNTKTLMLMAWVSTRGRRRSRWCQGAETWRKPEHMQDKIASPKNQRFSDEHIMYVTSQRRPGFVTRDRAVRMNGSQRTVTSQRRLVLVTQERAEPG